MKNIDLLKRELELEEGKKKEAYKDSEGLWTIAIGHRLNEQTDAELEILGLDDDLESWQGFLISDKQIYQLLDHDIEETLRSLRNAFDDELLEDLDPKRFMAAFQMCYQIGSVTGFPAFCNAVREGRFDDAADEMLWRNGQKKEVRSKWYRQTPGRCQKMSDLMRHGNSPRAAKDTLTEISETLRVSELSKYSNEEIAGEVLRRLNS